MTAITWRDVAEGISWIVGWTYFALWTFSFYPQFLQNRARRSTLGVATSYFPLNILGFLCYSLYTALLLYSPTIRSEYATRYPNAPNPTVRLNDLAFAVHALVLATLTYSQFFPAIWGYETGRKRERTRPIIWGVIIGIISTLLLIASIAAGNEADGELDTPISKNVTATPTTPNPFPNQRITIAAGSITVINQDENNNFFSFDKINYLDVTTALSLSKLIVTLIKYLPQIYINYVNKSTEGFSIWQILADFFGGVLSLVQLGIDAALEGGWDGVKGNIVKTGLGVISMALNVVFIIQHYIIYTGREQVVGSDEDDEDDEEEEGGRVDEEAGRGSTERTPLVRERERYVDDGGVSE
ncbi:hypothetical protein AOL_s00097g54 [Orbilia oligospora ATCC 24927]|uniref:Cystinosin n=1 Tax=Arthrobotrys oligospora (strain ATCC 24927 / CBS 115.81 / DSM 1491) TaxID=756982 RepID=G1XI77_ARTOA|nr:hypothetical protein AOL_s00097g54 [Orbilia oligospora ATCC 24927]EGX47008.1 hypothetical protein AOL_s00097g54 [Orbilia oligospora ATCC 24927]